MAGDFSVGDWIVRPERLCIHLPEKTVHITPKSMAVLQCLADARGDVVSRNDILDTVWPGAAVTDDVLTQCVVELRKAFDDSANDPQYIETIPRKGFRLVAPVSALDEEPATRYPFRAIVAAVLAVALIGAGSIVYFYQIRQAPPEGPTTIAVLPFTDLSPGGDHGFFTDGLTEQLIEQLTQLGGLEVTGEALSSAFEERGEDLQKIGRQLGVEYLVDGSVREVDEELRVTAKLTNVDSGLLEWSDTYPAAADDELLEVQRRVAGAVADIVGVGLGVSEIATMVGGTSNINAYEAFLAGEAAFDIRAPDHFEAIKHYEQAVEADPEYAIAWARLAKALSLASGFGHLRLEERKEHAIATALRLAPDSEKVLDTDAQLKVFQGKYREARLRFDEIHARYEGREIPYSESYFDFSMKMGRLGDALLSIYSIQRHDYPNPVNPVLLNQFFLIVDQVDRALEEAEQKYQEGYRGALPGTAVPIALASGRVEEIEKWLQRVHLLQERHNLYPMTSSELLLENLRDEDALREIFKLRGPVFGDYWLSQWAVYVGDDELALEVLQRSPMPWVFWSPIFKDIRKTDEFKQILIDIGLVEYWREFGWGHYCRPTDGDDFECNWT